jgi:hypothetical protein
MDSNVVTAVVQSTIGGSFLLIGVWLKHQLENRQKVIMPDAVGGQLSPPDFISELQKRQINIVGVILDVGIILLLTAAVGFVIGITAQQANEDDLILGLGLGSILFTTVGFVISGARTGGNRWPHLVAVAIVLWIVSGFINVLFLGFPIELWFLSIAWVLFAMVVGGALSYLFKR